MKVLAGLLLSVLTASCAGGTAPTRGPSVPDGASASEGPSGAPREALPWVELGPAAFAKARAEHRLVVIDGSAEWCHWCHVMEATTYHDPEVRKILDARYVAVKVDVDARPDFEERYEEWGWPATVLMSADGQELGKYKGYLAPEKFLDILQTAATSSASSAARDGAEVETMTRALSPRDLDAAWARIARQLDDTWDDKQGGWGTWQKAPLAWENAWALSRARAGDARARERVLFALEQQSAIVDPVWGGMCQYSTDADWKHPHHEKLMTVQAGAIANYAEAYALTKDPKWLDRARKVRGFVDGFLTGEDGEFLTTMDADLGAHEAAGSGRPYVTGNDYAALDDAHRRALGIPRVDAHAYARDNGLAIDAYVTLFDASGDATALAAAKKAAERVLATHEAPGGAITHGAHADDDGKVLFLADDAALGFGLVHLYAATHDAATLAAAQRLADFLLSSLYDAKGGGFWATTPDPAAVGVFAVRHKTVEGNAMAARFLERLGKLAPDARYADAIATALAVATRAAAVEARGRFVGDVLLAIDDSR